MLVTRKHLPRRTVLGTCDNTSCSLTNTIAWRTPTTVLPCDNDPRSVFERLFGRRPGPLC